MGLMGGDATKEACGCQGPITGDTITGETVGREAVFTPPCCFSDRMLQGRLTAERACGTMECHPDSFRSM